jgi:transcriptional regulator with XRE-family HTH domain
MKKSIVAERLSELRQHKGLRLYEVAQGTGLTKTTISRYENSKRENIGLNQLRLLAKFYNVDIEYLTGGTSDIAVNDIDLLILFAKLTDTGKMKVYQAALSAAREEGIL